MLIQKGAREDAIHALINIWIKDTTPNCGWCGSKFDKDLFPCCESPYIATNYQILSQFKKELDIDRELLSNKFGSVKDNSIRLTIKMPPGLLRFLEKSFMIMYGEKLFNEEYPVDWFAKKFYKYFAVPKEI